MSINTGQLVNEVKFFIQQKLTIPLDIKTNY